MLLRQNYHMHTARCGHANGTDRAFVEAAIAAGFETVGFSDHTPFPEGYPRNDHVRMAYDQLEDYVSSVLSLREEYKNDIRLLLGLEVEYYPEWFAAWQTMTSQYPFDYFLLGQHFVEANDYSFYSGRTTDNPATLHAYVERCIAGMQTGAFLYLAHPDMMDFHSVDSDFYESEMRRLCEAAKSLEFPLEINLLGIQAGRAYPNPRFWQIAGSVGNDVVLGLDAHRPEAYAYSAASAVAERLIQQFGLRYKPIML